MPTRRQFLRAASLAAVSSAAYGITGCGPQQRIGGENQISLWHWNRSVSEKLMAQVPKRLDDAPLLPQKIGGEFKPKLLTSLAGKAYVPDITGINDDIATYFPDADQFLDLHELGAREVEDDYLPWKWQLGSTPEGRMIGFPMDTGPTALYYRPDLFAEAGFPTEPGDVAEAMATWDDYLEAGKEYVGKNPDSTWIPSSWNVFYQAVAQQPLRYMDRQDTFIAADSVRRAWNLATRSAKHNLGAKVEDWSPEWNSVLTTGKTPTFVGAVWAGAILKDGAPDTSGNWRVCRAPGGAGNAGGSFLAITKYCQRPEKAFEIVRWLQSPKNQVQAFVEFELFPSTPAAYDYPQMRQPDEFFGGQKTIEVFAESARNVKPAYLSPYDALIEPSFEEEMVNVGSLGKDPDRAWDDALQTSRRELERGGVI